MPPDAPPLSRQLEVVADAVAAVRAGRSLTDALARVTPILRPAAQALSFQVLRQLGAALVLRRLLVPKPPAPALDALLLTALALLWPGEDAPPYAEHTLVDQAVAAARRRQPAAAGFVNAVLRRWLRERAGLQEAALREPQARYQHPPWWIARLRADWPAEAADVEAHAGAEPVAAPWQALLRQANRRAPMALRVNVRRSSVTAYLAALRDAGLDGQPWPDRRMPQAIVLDRPCPVHALPGWDDGWVSVQDAHAQLAAPLLLGPTAGLPPLPPGARVLDACAAPGGKTAQLLELADLDLLALDSDGQRLERLHENLARLGLRGRSACADARAVDQWWDGRRFDAILLDAPCSASGIVRRHPDVRWLRRPEDIAALARTQAELLDALWPLLAPGGRLLYATCSVFKDEGERQIDAFLQRTLQPRPWRCPGSPGHLLGLPDNSRARNAGSTDASKLSAENPAEAAPRQGDDRALAGDGFFYALLGTAAPD